VVPLVEQKESKAFSSMNEGIRNQGKKHGSRFPVTLAAAPFQGRNLYVKGIRLSNISNMWFCLVSSL
jgi:hypothetical protein